MATGISLRPPSAFMAANSSTPPMLGMLISVRTMSTHLSRKTARASWPSPAWMTSSMGSLAILKAFIKAPRIVSLSSTTSTVYPIASLHSSELVDFATSGEPGLSRPDFQKKRPWLISFDMFRRDQHAVLPEELACDHNVSRPNVKALRRLDHASAACDGHAKAI